ncbi:MAG TPA: methylated-DNA--[protein]-cysteine S-methyltransferase [Burkholderiales bacterium]|nr:methylated-DNA--[protein]-cysteine S-methyltransferase [Burkholderiales bacterium]
METPCFDAVLPTPFGAFGIFTVGDVIAEVVYLPPGTPALPARSAVADEAVHQIGRYLNDPDYRFQLPLRPAGTPFQQRVWDEISKIQRGRVHRYGDLAKRLASAPRAVGQACGANPFPPLIPCHRVVAAAGIGGFANQRDGFLIASKRWLLAHEGCPL